jgi:hypothetical protein
MVVSLIEERRESFVVYERSFVTVTFLRHSYEFLNLNNYAIKLCIEIGFSHIFGYNLRIEVTP